MHQTWWLHQQYWRHNSKQTGDLACPQLTVRPCVCQFGGWQSINKSRKTHGSRMMFHGFCLIFGIKNDGSSMGFCMIFIDFHHQHYRGFLQTQYLTTTCFRMIRMSTFSTCWLNQQQRNGPTGNRIGKL